MLCLLFETGDNINTIAWVSCFDRIWSPPSFLDRLSFIQPCCCPCISEHFSVRAGVWAVCWLLLRMSNTFARFYSLWLLLARWFVRFSCVLFRAVSSSFMSRQFYFPLTFHPRIRGAFVGCRSCLCLPHSRCPKLTLWLSLPCGFRSRRGVNFEWNETSEPTLLIGSFIIRNNVCASVFATNCPVKIIKWSDLDYKHVVCIRPSCCLFSSSAVFFVRLKTAYNDLIAYQFQLTNWLLRAECAAILRTFHHLLLCPNPRQRSSDSFCMKTLSHQIRKSSGYS